MSPNEKSEAIILSTKKEGQEIPPGMDSGGFEVNQSQTIGPDKINMQQSIRKRGTSVTVEQSIRVLGRHEILQLTEIPTPYLVDELEARGIIQVTDSGGVKLIRASLSETVNRILDHYKGEKDLFSKLEEAIMVEAYKLNNNSQYHAAAMLGMQRRVFHYRFHHGPARTLGIQKRPFTRKKLCEIEPIPTNDLE